MKNQRPLNLLLTVLFRRVEEKIISSINDTSLSLLYSLYKTGY